MAFPNNNRQNYRMRPNNTPPPIKNPYLSHQELKKKAQEYNVGQLIPQDKDSNSSDSRQVTPNTSDMTPRRRDNLIIRNNDSMMVRDINNATTRNNSDMNDSNRMPLGNDWATKSTRSWMDSMDNTMSVPMPNEETNENLTPRSNPYDNNRSFPWMNPRGDERLSPSTTKDITNRPPWLMYSDEEDRSRMNMDRQNRMDMNRQNRVDMNEQNRMDMDNQNRMDMNEQNRMDMDRQNRMFMEEQNRMGMDRQSRMDMNRQNRMDMNWRNGIDMNDQDLMNMIDQNRMNINRQNRMDMNNQSRMNIENENLPFLPRNEEENEEYRKMIQRHPQDVRRIYTEVQKAFDRLSYAGSWIYDENPDRATLLRLSEDIYRSLLPITEDYDPSTDQPVTIEEENRVPGLLPNKKSPRWMLYVVFILVQNELMNRRA